MNKDSQKNIYRLVKYRNRNSDSTHVLIRELPNHYGYIYLNAHVDNIPSTREGMHTTFMQNLRG